MNKRVRAIIDELKSLNPAECDSREEISEVYTMLTELKDIPMDFASRGARVFASDPNVPHNTRLVPKPAKEAKEGISLPYP